MATVVISGTGTQITYESDDAGATRMVLALAEAFDEASGVWLGGPFTQDGVDSAARSMVRWIPAASASVTAVFDDVEPPAALQDLPGAQIKMR